MTGLTLDRGAASSLDSGSVIEDLGTMTVGGCTITGSTADPGG